MPVLAAPAYLLAAIAASAVVVALHLLAWRRPRPAPLPTARFAPPSAVRTLSRDVRLSDALLLLLRVAALLLAGLALARPALRPSREGTARVLVVDASRRVASMTEARDSARARAAGAAAVTWIRVDSAPSVVSDSAIGERAEVRGHLGSGVVAAIREAHRLAETHDSVAIVVVSPFAAESWDAGVEAMRGAWEGEVQAVRVKARDDGESGRSGPERVAGAQGAALRDLPPARDPLGAAFALALDRPAPPIRVRRDAPGAGDSAWVREGGIFVWWPESPTIGSDSSRGAASPGSGGAGAEVLTSGVRSVAGRFARPAMTIPAGAVILRWGDGAAAATEQALGRGCIRAVGVVLPERGDEVLRPGFTRLVRELAGACGGGSAGLVEPRVVDAWAEGTRREARGAMPQAAASATQLKGDVGSAVAGESGRAAARQQETADAGRGVQRWLLLGVAALLLAEWAVRRRRRVEGAIDDRADAPAPWEAA